MSFDKLKNYLAELEHLKKVTYILYWDQATCMPKASAAHRAAQFEAIEKITHARSTSVVYQNLLDDLVDLNSGDIRDQSLSELETRAVSVLWRDYKKQNALTCEFVGELSNAQAFLEVQWEEAKKTGEAKTYLQGLKKIIELTREKGERVAEALGLETAYDGLLDDYETGVTRQEFDQFFETILAQTPGLLKRLQAKGDVDDSFMHQHFPAEGQKKLSQSLVDLFGFKKDSFFLSESVHPFSLPVYPNDIRITTRYREDFLLDSLYSTIHELGHALYESLLPSHALGTPLCQASTSGVHEAQSRFFENVLFRHPCVMEKFLGLLKTTFPDQFKSVNEQTLLRAVNKVEPGFIRTDADELTYNIHIAIRYKIEQQLIKNELQVHEIEECWNALYKEFLGLEIKDPKQGYLQDVHWSGGAFGYFPTYAWGNAMAATQFQVYCERHSDWEERFKNLDIKHIGKFLSDHIYQFGRTLNSKELTQGMGGVISAENLLKYLENRYQDVFQI